MNTRIATVMSGFGGVAAAGFGRDSPLALTHHSALAVWGIPVHGVDERVHLTSTDGRRGRNDARVSFHRPVPPPLRHDAPGDLTGPTSGGPGRGTGRR